MFMGSTWAIVHSGNKECGLSEPSKGEMGEEFVWANGIVMQEVNTLGC